jgi:hypothetical protein
MKSAKSLYFPQRNCPQDDSAYNDAAMQHRPRREAWHMAIAPNWMSPHPNPAWARGYSYRSAYCAALFSLPLELLPVPPSAARCVVIGP